MCRSWHDPLRWVLFPKTLSVCYCRVFFFFFFYRNSVSQRASWERSVMWCWFYRFIVSICSISKTAKRQSRCPYGCKKSLWHDLNIFLLRKLGCVEIFNCGTFPAFLWGDDSRGDFFSLCEPAPRQFVQCSVSFCRCVMCRGAHKRVVCRRGVGGGGRRGGVLCATKLAADWDGSEGGLLLAAAISSLPTFLLSFVQRLFTFLVNDIPFRSDLIEHGLVEKIE